MRIVASAALSASMFLALSFPAFSQNSKADALVCKYISDDIEYSVKGLAYFSALGNDNQINELMLEISNNLQILQMNNCQPYKMPISASAYYSNAMECSIEKTQLHTEAVREGLDAVVRLKFAPPSPKCQFDKWERRHPFSDKN